MARNHRYMTGKQILAKAEKPAKSTAQSLAELAKQK